MSTTTLSQRLRALASTVHTVELIEPLREMAAMAEAQEAQAGELSNRIHCPRCMPPGDPCCPYCDGAYELAGPVVAHLNMDPNASPETIEAMKDVVQKAYSYKSPREHAWEARGMNGHWWCLNCGVCGGNSTAPANVGPCADRGPSDTCSGEPSQAIGKQTPVAWIYEDSLPEGYPYDLMFPYSEVRDFVRMFPVYGPSPLSPEARDRAIEALESIGKDAREIFDHGASLLTVKAGSGRIIAVSDRALSVLRGE